MAIARPDWTWARGWPRAAAWVAAAVIAIGLLPVPAARAAVTDPLLFYVTMGDCFYGSGPGDVDIRITWRAAGGALKDRFDVHTSQSAPGYWNPPDGTCDTNEIVRGDTLKARVLTFPQAPRTFTVERLSITFDRRTDVIGGRGPANSTLHMTVTRCYGFCLFPEELCQPNDVGVDGTGRYSRDVTNCDGSGYDAIGFDYASVTWESPAGDTAYAWTQAQFALFAVGTPTTRGQVLPFQAVTIEARRPNGTLRGTAHDTADAHGIFKAPFRNASGAKLDLRIGDRVTGDWAGTVSFVIPDIGLTFRLGDHTIDPENNTIDGYCVPNAPYRVTMQWAGGGGGGTGGTTDASGDIETIHVEWFNNHTLESGDSATLWCRRKNGDQVQLREVVP